MRTWVRPGIPLIPLALVSFGWGGRHNQQRSGANPGLERLGQWWLYGRIVLSKLIKKRILEGPLLKSFGYPYMDGGWCYWVIVKCVLTSIFEFEHVFEHRRSPSWNYNFGSILYSSHWCDLLLLAKFRWEYGAYCFSESVDLIRSHPKPIHYWMCSRWCECIHHKR